MEAERRREGGRERGPAARTERRGSAALLEHRDVAIHPLGGNAVQAFCHPVGESDLWSCVTLEKETS